MSADTRTMTSVVSKDGTRIAYDRSGAGPALILVDGALCFRAFGPMAALAKALAPHSTVYAYDRRGRGESGAAQPYAVAREIEDMEAIIARAGGSACLFGMSSGAALALKAAESSPGIEKVALYEPPFVGGMADYGRKLHELLSANRKGDAVELFLTTVGTPAPAIAGMRKAPFWPMLESIAPTLGYDNAVLSDGASPGHPAKPVDAPVLVMAGGASPEVLRQAARNVAQSQSIPHARLRILEGQGHDASPDALAPVLTEFFLGGRS